jgi:hypothetical protein
MLLFFGIFCCIALQRFKHQNNHLKSNLHRMAICKYMRGCMASHGIVLQFPNFVLSCSVTRSQAINMPLKLEIVFPVYRTRHHYWIYDKLDA